jgi:hypothetical protein
MLKTIRWQSLLCKETSTDLVCKKSDFRLERISLFLFLDEIPVKCRANNRSKAEPKGFCKDPGSL